MRILFVTAHRHLPELRGGMEVNTHDLCRALQGRGITVGVLCGLAGRGLTGLAARARIRLLHDAAPMDRILAYPTWRSWNVVAQAGRVATLFRPDVIVLQGGAEFAALARSCLGVGVPVICYAHTSDPLALDAGLAGSRHLHFIANSHYTASLHADRAIAAVVRPLVPRERYATATDRTLAVFINPLPYKGLAVVDGLAARRPDVGFLYVANGGPSVAAHGPPRPRNVRVVGPVADMRRIYRRAKLLLAPSQCDETWGRMATEAHASGIPVLASRRGGLMEAVGPGGLCLDSGAPAAEWAEAFSLLWDDPVRHDGFVAAARAFSLRPEIDVRTILAVFVDVMTAVVGGRRAGM